MKTIIGIIVFLFTQITFSQSSQAKIVKSDDFVYMTNQVSVAPQFVGGKIALDSYIKLNFKQPKGNYKKGEVLVTFVVEKNGKLSEIGILSDAGSGTGDEAIRVMSASPTWISGTIDGKPVRVQYLVSIPVIFK